MDDSRILVASGTGVDHAAAMAVQRMYDEAVERERERQSSRMAGAAPFRYRHYLGEEKPALVTVSDEPTDFDRGQLVAAQEKRERKRQKRAGEYAMNEIRKGEW